VKTKRAIAIGIGLAAAATALTIAWDSSRRPRFRKVAPGVEFAEYVVSPFRFHTFARAHVIRVDLEKAALAIAYPGDGSFSVRDLVEATGAQCGTNGGFFDENHRALGLQVSGGKRLTPFRRTDGGVFVVDEAGARVIHSLKFDPSREARFAIQCMPRLVVDGKPLRLKPQSAHRTAIGVDRTGRVILVVTSGQPFRADHFARLLASDGKDGGLECREALNLDGGGSSQMFLRAGGVRCDVPGSDKVASAVVVFGGKR